MLAGVLLVFPWSCSPVPEDKPEGRVKDRRPLLALGVISGGDPRQTYDGFQPLIDHLTEQTPFLFRLSLARDTDDLLRYVEERMAEVVPLGAVSYLEAHSQFGAVPLVRPLNRDGEPVSSCVFVVREDSPITSFSDLEKRSLALGWFHSTLSNLIARDELARAGVELQDLGAIEQLASDEAIASAVLEGRFDAGAVNDLVARRYEEKGLRAFHVSPPVSSGPLVIRGDLPEPVIRAMREAFLKLDAGGAEERELWDETIRGGFALSTDADYDSVRQIVSRASESCSRACHTSVAY